MQLATKRSDHRNLCGNKKKRIVTTGKKIMKSNELKSMQLSVMLVPYV
jgi:hypothetical protein